MGVFSRRDDGLVEEARRLAGLDLDELASLLLPLVVRYDASKFGVHGPSDGELAGQLVDGKLPNEELRGLVDAVAEALQRLEHAGLVRYAVRNSSSPSLEHVATRAGSRAVAAGDVTERLALGRRQAP